MSDESRVEQLLEETLESGRPVEEVCAQFPQLLWQVQERLRRCQSMEAQIDAMFPPSSDGIAARRRRLLSTNDSLPQIPGYQVESILGRGGVGLVYRAKHLKLNRYVALKMLLSGTYGDPHEAARFTREAQAVASLRHAHIVQVYDIGEWDGKPYFTMEIMEGGSLAAKLEGTPQPTDQAAALLLTLATAAHAAHQGGVIHRDLKPSNILLTAEGVPKISDFGLAQRLAQDATATQVPAHAGTPSYMAPEQVLGKLGAIGPATDVYGLGAILYETLTGRPPFRGGTASETERQVLSDDPVPPSRLRTKIPRDLETICLKCLEKDAARRYATAAALADDLGRFQRGEPILARPVGWIARAIKLARRRPAEVMVLAMGTCAAPTVLAVIIWVATDRAASARAINADLDEAVRLQEAASWAQANAAIERARLRLDNGGPETTRARLRQIARDADLVPRLEAIRISHAYNKGDFLQFEQAGRAYEAAFQEFGFSSGPADIVGARVRESHIHAALIDALYDWAGCAADKAKVRWLLDVAGAAQPDPTGWRARALDAQMIKSQDAVRVLASDPALASQPVSLQLVVANSVSRANRDPSPILLRTLRAHPNDLWVILALGDHNWHLDNFTEAIRYYQAAAAVRPDVALGHFDLGLALAAAERPVEAIDEYQEALRVGGNADVFRVNLAAAYSMAAQHQEACREFDLVLKQIAQQHPPKAARYEGAYAYSLMMVGRDAEAADWAIRAVSMEPDLVVAPTPAHAVLLHAQRWDQILLAWGAWLRTDAASKEEAWWRGYAELALFSGNIAEYRRACSEELKRFGNANDPLVCEGIGRACLLVDPPKEVLQAAAALLDRTLAGEQRERTWRYPYFMFSKGLAELRAGHTESSLAIMQGPAATALPPAPKLIAALAQARLGHSGPALATLAEAELAFDWSPYKADSREAWVLHVLRREAERAILPELPRFLSGGYQPQDDMERLAMCGECQFRELYAARARLLQQVIDAHPELAAQLRPTAMTSAALAGGGAAKDTPVPSDSEREHWRSQARTWMREELTLAGPRDAEHTGQSVATAKAALAAWLATPELGCVRDPAALSVLPAAEQQEWTALWEQVRKLAPVTKN